MEETCLALPENCWVLIIVRHLDDYRDWEPLSLVSKMFLSITNHFRVSLKIINPSIDVLFKQLKRFPNLKKIDLSNSRRPIQEILPIIAKSLPNLENLNISHQLNPPTNLLKELGFQLKNIKVLSCSHSYMTDSDLIVISDFFTSLEELDISHQNFQNITDEGIIALSMKLKGLKKINLSGNKRISDHSIISLSTNCKLLTEAILSHCYGITQIGISFLMENSPCYSSLILASNIFLKNPFTCSNSKNVTTVELYGMEISDELLYNINNANLSLKKFHLSFCKNFTKDGIYSLTKTYKSLESLALEGTDFLTDETVACISQYISKLISINLDSCFKLTSSTFYIIMLACPLINNIKMVLSSSSSSSSSLSSSSILNPSLKSASFTCINLEGLLHVFPNIETLNVTTLAHTHELDIAFILHHCPQLRHLTVNHRDLIVFNLELEDHEVIYNKLESLNARKSKIDDDVLEMVGKSCPNLLKLDLERCANVTEKGVKAVVQNCRQLRSINLDCCINVNNKDVVSWMVASCSSLRQIVIPNTLDHNEVDFSSFLSQGCIVYPGQAVWEDWCFFYE